MLSDRRQGGFVRCAGRFGQSIGLVCFQVLGFVSVLRLLRDGGVIRDIFSQSD